MKPVSAPSIIQRGIALYAPVQDNAVFLTLNLYFSEQNPVFSWLTCNNSQTQIWNKRQQQKENGTLFLYQLTGTLLTLPLGFYTANLEATFKDGSTKSGSFSLGVLQPTPHLIIGLPYSIYPPIDLA